MIMDNKTIVTYLQSQLNLKEKRLITMDKRHKIPRTIKDEIKELNEMIEFLSKLNQPNVSICACGSNEFFVEHYKDVVKYYCRECKEKIPSKN